jgi:hypothetical protein
MVGYKNPPSNTRFKKGESGNPNGRPKKPEPATAVKASGLVLKEADKLVQVRVGDKIEEITMEEALLRSEMKTAVNGNPLAQKHTLDRIRHARQQRCTEIAEDLGSWRGLVGKLRWVFAEYEVRNLPPPDIWPHPDDVIFDEEKGVSIVGPADKEQAADMSKRMRLRPILFEQNALDVRAKRPRSDDPLDGAGTAIALVRLIDSSLPPRCRLSESEYLNHYFEHRGKSQRILMKELRREWRSVDIPMRRGATFVSLRGCRQILVPITMLQNAHTGRTIGEALAPTPAGENDYQLVSLNSELLYMIIQFLSEAQDGEPVLLSAKEAMRVAEVLVAALSQRLIPGRTLAVRKEAERRVAEVAEKMLKRSAPGLSKETVSEIRRAVLGIAG